jgi:hypothetical protein
MDALARALVIAALILGGAFIVRGLYPADRFTIVAAPGGGAYRVDRLTGSVSFCDALLCRTLPLIAFAPGSPGAPKQPAAPAPGSTGT